MRTFILALTAVVGIGLVSAPAHADHRHTIVSFSIGYGAPYPYGFYRPWPYYGYGYGYGYPAVGVGVSPRTKRVQEKPGEQQALKMYVYPAGGQSESQMAEDRYQCHVWAADQSGYDPTLGAGKRADADNYTRAFTACMEGRNYVVK